MRGLMNSCAPISGFSVAVAGQTRDLDFLRRQGVTGVRGGPARSLPGGEELAAGALSERVSTHAAEHVVRRAELFARVHAAVLTT